MQFDGILGIVSQFLTSFSESAPPCDWSAASVHRLLHSEASAIDLLVFLASTQPHLLMRSHEGRKQPKTLHKTLTFDTTANPHCKMFKANKVTQLHLATMAKPFLPPAPCGYLFTCLTLPSTKKKQRNNDTQSTRGIPGQGEVCITSLCPATIVLKVSAVQLWMIFGMNQQEVLQVWGFVLIRRQS